MSVADNPAWRNQIDKQHKPVSSHELLTSQRFRDLFVNEPLPEGESFQIKWMALMFTDLGGSTAIYARKGDPRAYSLVREHFRLIFDAVNESGGTVVNAAARVQGLAAHGETVLTRQVLDDVGVRELVQNPSPPETLVLRGLDDQPFEVVRVK